MSAKRKKRQDSAMQLKRRRVDGKTAGRSAVAPPGIQARLLH
jgi:hypothetical protein